MFTNAVLTSFAEDTQVSYEHLLIGIKNMDNSLKAARKVDSKKKTGFNPLAEL
jgi:hypothetical protein